MTLKQLYRGIRRRLQPHPLTTAIQDLERHGERFVYADVGACGGLHWRYHELARRGLVQALLFDPQDDWRKQRNPDEYAGCQVTHVPVALGDENGTRSLYITAAPPCSSLLPPNEAVLARYPVREFFAVTGRMDVRVARFTDVQQERGLPTPDVVKVDVQGAELAVLRGFGAALESVAFVELEAAIEPLYRGQPTLVEMRQWMMAQGFLLRDLKPQGPFEGEAFEFNSFWSRSPARLTPRQRRIGALWHLIHDVWPGEFHGDVAARVRHFVQFTDRG